MRKKISWWNKPLTGGWMGGSLIGFVDFGFDRFTDCSLDSYSHGSLGMHFRNRISFDA